MNALPAGKQIVDRAIDRGICQCCFSIGFVVLV